MKQQISQLLFLGLLAAQAFSEHYELDILTGAKQYDGTKDDFEATIICSKGRVEFGVLDNSKVWKAWRGMSENFEAQTEKNMGKVECVEIRAKAYQRDAWMVSSITVTVGSEKTYLYNTDGSFLTSDPSEGKDVMQFCVQGVLTYGLEITTANKAWAGTGSNKVDVGVMFRTNSRNGGTTGGTWQNIFSRGKTDHFILRDLKNIGMPDCLTLTYRESDAWLIDEITVIKDRTSRVFKNQRKSWLSSSDREGPSTLQLCYN